MARYTEKKKISNQNWDKEHLKRSSFSMSIELFNQFEKYCIDKGISKNSVINQAVIERMKKDNYLSDNIDINNIDA